MSRHPKELRAHLKRLIMLRLFVVTLFLCFGFVASEVQLALFSLIVGILALSVAYSFWLVWGKHLSILAVVQIGMDLLLESILIFFTGGIDSIFSMLIIFTIFSAGFVINPNSGFITAMMAGIMFLPSSIYGREISDWLYVAYTAYVKISILLLVGFLSTAFAHRFSAMEEEIQLKRRLSLLGETAAQLAHEIRNPLMSITGAIELLHRQLTGTLTKKDDLLMKTVVRESERLTGLLSHVLDYTRDEKYHFERVDLKRFLDEVFLMLENHFSCRSNIEIVKAYRRKKAIVEIDRNKMKQVFINLVVNGLQAMPEGGCLSVDSYRQNGFITITVQDTGCGMTPEQAKRLFIPFERQRSGGTGIGLALAQKIVCQHRGRISVDSHAGSGSTFSITLPAA